MFKLVLSRLLQGVVVLLIVSALVFALLAAAGGDALTALGGDPLVREETIEALRRVYGLDQPLPVRYARWLAGLARGGDFGYSFYYHAPVAGVIAARLPNTLLLAAAALAFACVFSLALGAWAARRGRGSWADRLCGLVILLAASTPRLVLALVALIFTARTSLFVVTPSASSAGAAEGVTMGGVGALLSRLVLPALVLSAPLVALFLAQTREGLSEALREDFVRVARAKGLSERAVVLRHALRAALNPLISIFGYSFGAAMSGSVIVETILGWPGLGQLAVVAVRSRDVPLLMGVVLVTSTAVLAGNLLADILQRANDPRLREGDARTAKITDAVSATTTAA